MPYLRLDLAKTYPSRREEDLFWALRGGAELLASLGLHLSKFQQMSAKSIPRR